MLPIMIGAILGSLTAATGSQSAPFTAGAAVGAALGSSVTATTKSAIPAANTSSFNPDYINLMLEAAMRRRNSFMHGQYTEDMDIFVNRDCINKIEFLRKNLAHMRQIAGISIEDAMMLLLLKSKQAIYTLERDPYRMTPTQYYAWIGIFFMIALQDDKIRNKILLNSIRALTEKYEDSNTSCNDLYAYEGAIENIANEYRKKYPNDNIIKSHANRLPQG